MLPLNVLIQAMDDVLMLNADQHALCREVDEHVSI
jgi:hypothetical protein